jgi:NAD(P)-dependent dehydrogenase (short-subunit alcohol dehydrogenase family)
VHLQLQGKLVLVSGSTSGIGLAIASALARESATVIVNGRQANRVAESVAEIRKKYPNAQVREFVGDLSKPEIADQAAHDSPDVQILVNNLGHYQPKPFEEITDQDWAAIIEKNFMSGVRLSRHYLSKMKAKNWGRIIFISSESAVNIPVEMIHYGVTKTMQLALARGLAGRQRERV